MKRKITLSPIKTQSTSHNTCAEAMEPQDGERKETYLDLANSLISAWEENNPTGTTFRIESPYITVLTWMNGNCAMDVCINRTAFCYYIRTNSIAGGECRFTTSLTVEELANELESLTKQYKRMLDKHFCNRSTVCEEYVSVSKK